MALRSSNSGLPVRQRADHANSPTQGRTGVQGRISVWGQSRGEGAGLTARSWAQPTDRMRAHADMRQVRYVVGNLKAEVDPMKRSRAQKKAELLAERRGLD